eukprot:13946047-Alexandrium_andersonii.AAC.1
MSCRNSPPIALSRHLPMTNCRMAAKTARSSGLMRRGCPRYWKILSWTAAKALATQMACPWMEV